MVFEELAVGILNLVNYGITILVIMLIIEIVRLVGSLGKGKIGSALGDKLAGKRRFEWLGNKIKDWTSSKDKAAEEAFDKTGKDIPIVPKGKNAEKVPELTKKKVKFNKEKLKDLLNQLFGSSRRVYRYNRRVLKHLERAHDEASNPAGGDLRTVRKELVRTTKFEEKEINFDALVNDIVSQISKSTNIPLTLKRDLNSLNNLIRKQLDAMKKEIGSSLVEKNIKKIPPRLVLAKMASEKIEKEIPGMQAVIKKIEDKL